MKDTARTTQPGCGFAGRRAVGDEEEDVRSDLFVTVTLTTQGGRSVHLESKVASLFGAALRRQVADVLGAMGVDHAQVEIEDQGALPFTVAARLEAAARRAGGHGAAPVPRAAEPRPRGPRDRLRRSRLYLPGNEPKFMINARLHHPDAVILDLEDSVHPDDKDVARLLVRNALRAVDFGAAERMVRINQLPLGLEDLNEVIPENPDLVLLPKTEHPDQVREVADHIAQIQRGRGGGESVWLMPILESAAGIERAFSIATATTTVAALTIGLEDYTADLGVAKTREGDESEYARRRQVNAARAAGIQAIDSVYGDVEDPEGLRAWALRSRAMGFEGMGCIHPRQIRIIHEAFRPTPQEMERAQEIVAAWEEARQRGLAVVSLGTRMIDPPVVERARRLVERARRMASAGGGA